jgi:predicted dehydrogenase
MKTFRWGILATGNIANSMAAALAHLPDAELLAVASRSRESAEEFASRWSVPRAYAENGALFGDPDIDIVYIAAPNSLHKEYILAALDAGKHVLCEKPLTTSEADTQICVQTARSQGLFLMEAMWTAFFPVVERARQLINRGAIGTPNFLSAQFIALRDREQFPNLFDPDLGGGATLDLGIYPLVISQLMLGPITEVSTQASFGKTGDDEMVAVSAKHKGQAISQLSFGFKADLPISVLIAGDKGQIIIPEDFHHPDCLILESQTRTETIRLPYIGNGYAHEAMEVHNCLRHARRESQVYPLELSLRSARLLNRIRRAH